MTRNNLRPIAWLAGALASSALAAAGMAGDPPNAGAGAGAASAGAGAALAPDAGAAIFANRCAVCHGPEAAGIPGSFPPLRDQVVEFAKTAEGRDYLAMVVTTGLMGSLKVAGGSYNGVMPAQSGLDEAQIAAVLSYLAGARATVPGAVAALSAKDVSEARTRHPEKSAQATRALRPAGDP